MVLDESGYTDMLKADKSPEAAGRLENLKELVRSMEEFESLAAFLEHVSLVMELEQNESGNDRLSLMTLHAAKGLEFETVFLPGWEEGSIPFPAHAGRKRHHGTGRRTPACLCRTDAREIARVRQFRSQSPGPWSVAERRAIAVHRRNPGTACRQSGERRILRELWRHGFSRQSGGIRQHLFQPRLAPRPGCAHRAAASKAATRYSSMRGPKRSQARKPQTSLYGPGERVFHQKFGYGRIVAVEGNKLLIDFDKAGSKRVMDGFVTRA